MTRAGLSFALLAASLFMAGTALAQETPPEEQEGSVVYSEGTIDTDETTSADRDIDRRLTGIFEALPAFRDIEVEVSGGVVRLTGQVAERETIAEAELLAQRISGVVAVDNAIEHDVSVSGRLAPAADRTHQLATETIALLPLLAVAAAVIIGFWLLGLLLGRQRWLWMKVAPNSLVGELIGTLVPVIFVVVGLVIALNILDAVAILSAVLGAAGVLGLAVGFAVRDTIENFISSVMLSLRQPFRASDFVDIDGRQGHVVRLTSRATILMTPDGNHVRIPNAQVFKAVIVNYTRNPERRFTFELGIDGEDDPKAAIDTGLERLAALDFILADPPPNGWIVKVGDSNIVLCFAGWIDQGQSDFLKAKSAAIRAVKAELETRGFTLPEPIYRLRIDQMPELPLSGTVTQTVPTQPAPEPETPPQATTEEDVTPDRSIEEKVEEDRRESGENDLLSPAAPTEFGDKSQPT